MVQNFCLIKGHFISDSNITGIAQLVNPPSNPEKKSERLGNFEGYWQIKLMTLEPYSLNQVISGLGNPHKLCRPSSLVLLSM